MWRPQIEGLPDYHLLVPDLPEHGKSARDAPFTIDRAAAEVAELIRTRTDRGRATVIGLSEGAQITVALLALAPALVERAIMSSPLARSSCVDGDGSRRHQGLVLQGLGHMRGSRVLARYGAGGD